MRPCPAWKCNLALAALWAAFQLDEAEMCLSGIAPLCIPCAFLHVGGGGVTSKKREQEMTMKK